MGRVRRRPDSWPDSWQTQDELETDKKEAPVECKDVEGLRAKNRILQSSLAEHKRKAAAEKLRLLESCRTIQRGLQSSLRLANQKCSELALDLIAAELKNVKLGQEMSLQQELSRVESGGNGLAADANQRLGQQEVALLDEI
jgi:hypothetical protein